MISGSDLCHLKPELSRQHFSAPVVLKIGMTGGDKQNFVELILVPGLFRDDQVPEMYRVESSAENSDLMRFYCLFSHDPAPSYFGRTILGFSLKGL